MDVNQLCENLRQRGFGFQVFPSGQLAVEYLTREIHDTKVGMGGSVTLDQLGLYEELKKTNEVYWHWDKEQVKREGSPDKVREEANKAPVYLCSLNSVSKDGQLINIDGAGNRLAATAYGQKKIYFVIGINKVSGTLEEAIARARNVAAPQNARRLGVKTPCAIAGDCCYDCSSPERICNGIMILERPMNQTKVEVVIIQENLGY